MAELYQGELLPKRFNELLNGPLSTRIAYLQALLCPCQGEVGGGADPKCPACTGLGYLWSGSTPQSTRQITLTRGPLPGHEYAERLSEATATIIGIEGEDGTVYPPEAVTVRPDGSVLWIDGFPAPPEFARYRVTVTGAPLRAGVQGVMSRREFQVRGEYDVLDLEMTLDRHLSDGTTPNPAWNCGENDRFTLLDQWRRHAQKLIRGARGGERTLYRQMRELTVASLDGSELVTYQPEEDYVFTDGTMTWQQGRGPKIGMTYTVQGEINPEYYVFQALPQTRQADGHQLPRRIVLKGFERFPNRRPPQAVR